LSRQLTARDFPVCKPPARRQQKSAGDDRNGKKARLSGEHSGNLAVWSRLSTVALS